ncbi:MAG: superoxide dismutase [Anaerolineae bacterium]
MVSRFLLKCTLLAISISSNLVGEENQAPAKTDAVYSQHYVAKDYSYLLGIPGFSNKLLEMHFQLYQGYVKNTNLLLDTLSKQNALGKSQTYEYDALKRRLGWEFDGMRLHELYFSSLGSQGHLNEMSALFKEITTQFGSYDLWKKDFIATGMMRGIGWVVLYRDNVSGRLINVWINEHDVGHLAGNPPLLIMDVFEHAYMPEWGLDRAAYITAFFNNINWGVVSKRFDRALINQ